MEDLYKLSDEALIALYYRTPSDSPELKRLADEIESRDLGL